MGQHTFDGGTVCSANLAEVSVTATGNSAAIQSRPRPVAPQFTQVVDSSDCEAFV
jgi:hypothetical protein